VCEEPLAISEQRILRPDAAPPSEPGPALQRDADDPPRLLSDGLRESGREILPGPDAFAERPRVAPAAHDGAWHRALHDRVHEDLVQPVEPEPHADLVVLREGVEAEHLVLRVRGQAPQRPAAERA